METTGSHLADLEGLMKHLREELRPFGDRMKSVASDLKTVPVVGKEDRPEEIANLMLAYRHMEDCIMRLGKVIQAYNGGENPLMPRNTSVVPGGVSVTPQNAGASMFADPILVVRMYDKNTVYYGPHSCQKCDKTGKKGTLICKAGNGAPDMLEFDYPVDQAEILILDGKGTPYPNTHSELAWERHICK